MFEEKNVILRFSYVIFFYLEVTFKIQHFQIRFCIFVRLNFNFQLLFCLAITIEQIGAICFVGVTDI